MSRTMKSPFKEPDGPPVAVLPSEVATPASECGSGSPEPHNLPRSTGGAASFAAASSSPWCGSGINSSDMPEMPVTNKHVVSRACDPEARLSDVPVDGTPSQTDPTAADHCVNPSDQVAPPSAPVVPSPAAFDLVALRERAESVMLGDGERPIASGIAAIASEATYGLIIAVRDAKTHTVSD